jgi:hypothetical protein
MRTSMLRALSVALLCVAPLLAQSSSQTQTTSNSGSKTGNDKVLGIGFPNYLVVDGEDTDAPRLTAQRKFELVGKSFFNPFTFLLTGAEAGLSQAADEHPGFGQGARGYGKRFGATLADTFTDDLFGTGVYPSIFHTDPRYYRKMQGNVVARGAYAVSRVLVTRTDSGRHVFNAPEVLGAATSSAIGMAYYPDDERTASDFMTRWGTNIAFDAALNVARELWPDVRDHVFRRHKQ